MAHHTTPIRQITTQTHQSWTAKVIVIEKSYQRHPMNSPGKPYQRLMLADSEGTRVQATIFGNDIDKLANTLSLLKTYLISNAIVKHVDLTNRIAPNEYQWILNTRTLIKEVTNTELRLPYVSHNLVLFSNFHTYKDCDTEIDMIAITVRMSPPKDQPTRRGPTRIQELVVVSDELKPMILTIWNQFIDSEAAVIADLIESKSIIVALRIKVVSYNGVELMLIYMIQLALYRVLCLVGMLKKSSTAQLWNLWTTPIRSHHLKKFLVWLNSKARVINGCK